MALADLLHVRQLFSRNRIESGDEAYRELLLMVLARATDVDAYTHPAEVETVQKVLCEYLGEDVTSADVRIAAKSALYEAAPLEKYVAKIGPKLSDELRLKLVSALIEVLRADEQVASSEADYFNKICEAVQISYAELAGLKIS